MQMYKVTIGLFVTIIITFNVKFMLLSMHIAFTSIYLHVDCILYVFSI